MAFFGKKPYNKLCIGVLRRMHMEQNIEGFTKEQKIARVVLILTVMVFSVWYTTVDMQHNGFASFLSVGMIGFTFAHIPMMLLAGLFGYVESMIFVLVVFLIGAVTDIQGCYQVFIFLIISGVTHTIVRRGWCEKIGMTILGAVISALILGDGWYLVSCLISSAKFSQISFTSLFFLFLMMLPECLIVYLALYFFYRFAPDRIKSFFYVGRFYTEEYKTRRSEGKAKMTLLGKHILIGLSIDVVVILAVALLLAGLLFQAVSHEQIFGKDANRDIITREEATEEEVTTGYEGDIVSLYKLQQVTRSSGEIVPGSRISSGDTYASFAVKLLMMMAVVVVSVIVLTYYVAVKLGVEPLKKVSTFMSEYASESDENKTEMLKQMPNMEPKVKDEIWDVYHSLLIMLGNMNRYISKIRDDKQIEAELEASRQANEAKTSFLSNMSHEIRTPINAVLGMDEVIIRETKEENTLSYARDIQSAGKTLLALINDILDFSKIESGKMEIIPAEYNVRDLVEDLVNMVSFRARGKGLNLEAKINPHLPVHLYGDELRLKQIITNILTNAVKYTEKGYVTLAVDYEKLDKKHIMLRVSVKDTGIGIKSEDLEKLFAPFERIDEKRNLTIEGSGLGMSIVRSLLFMMGSSLDVKSTYGRGSNFSFEVVQEVLEWHEIGDVDIQSSELKPIKKYHESFRAPNAKILVVDDTKTNHLVMKGLLKNTRVKIDMANSGNEALYLMKTHHYHMLFVDHRMPGMDGIEMMQHLLSMTDNVNIDTPAIAMTANVVSGAREMYLENGFWDYISKPVDGERLEEMMVTYLPPELVEFPHDEGFEEDTTRPAEKVEAEEEEPESGEDISDLQKLQGVDLNEAMQNCGDAETLRDIVKEFRTVIEEKADQIEEYFNARDYKNYTVQVHALKSSARLIGANDLSKQAEYLEACGNEENEVEIVEKTPGLLSLYRSYVEKLAAIGEEEKVDEDKPMIDAEGFLSALDDLKELLIVYDFDNADQIMAQLDNYQIPEEHKDKYERIKLLMAEVDRDRLLEIL